MSEGGGDRYGNNLHFSFAMHLDRRFRPNSNGTVSSTNVKNFSSSSSSSSGSSTGETGQSGLFKNHCRARTRNSYSFRRRRRPVNPRLSVGTSARRGHVRFHRDNSRRRRRHRRSPFAAKRAFVRHGARGKYMRLYTGNGCGTRTSSGIKRLPHAMRPWISNGRPRGRGAN